MQKSFLLSLPSPGYRISGKEVEVCDSGSWHHQLCGCCNLQLIQNHGAPSHGPLVRVLSPLFFSAKSLLLPKLRGKKKHSKTTWSSPIHSFRTSWSSSLSFRTAWISLFTSELCGPLYSSQNRVVLFFSLRTAWSSLPMAAAPRFKSQRLSSFAALLPTPPTISYTCQHSCILPALLGCHSKSWQVWPYGMEPIFSKLSCRSYNQGDLLPSYILG